MASSSSSAPMELTSDQKSNLGKRKATEDPEDKDDKEDLEEPSVASLFKFAKAIQSPFGANFNAVKTSAVSGLQRPASRWEVRNPVPEPETDVIRVQREKVNQGFLVDNTVFMFQNITSIDLSINVHKAVFIIRSGLNKYNTVELLHRPNSKFFLFHERISNAFMQYKKDNFSCNMTLKSYCNPKEKNISMSDVISVTWGKSPITQGSSFASVGYLYRLYVHRKSTDELQVIHEGTYLDIIGEFNRLIAECCLINMNSIKD